MKSALEIARRDIAVSSARLSAYVRNHVFVITIVRLTSIAGLAFIFSGPSNAQTTLPTATSPATIMWNVSVPTAGQAGQPSDGSYDSGNTGSSGQTINSTLSNKGVSGYGSGIYATGVGQQGGTGADGDIWAATAGSGGTGGNGLAGVTNITSTAGSILRANGGVVGTISRPVTVNLPMVTTNSPKEQGGVSVDINGHVGDNMIWLIQTPPGLVFLNGMIMNAGQVPGVSQDAYSTALGVLDQTYLTSNGIVLNTRPYSTMNAFSNSMYPTDSNDKAFTYGPYIYKLPGSVKVKDGGLKLPAGLQVSSMKK